MKRATRARRSAVAALAILMSMLLPGALAAQDAALKLYSKKAGYDDVRFDLQNAIIARGLTVDFNGQVSKMLERTGPDVGSSKVIYKQAEYFTFCSAKLSRATMEADPVNVGLCPYVIFMYETVGAPGTVHVGYRRPPRQGSAKSKAALGAIDTLLDGIAREAVK